MAPIIMFREWHDTVETSTFGSEFTALKNMIELVEELWYKLCMFRFPIEGATNMFCDNESVYKKKFKSRGSTEEETSQHLISSISRSSCSGHREVLKRANGVKPGGLVYKDVAADSEE